MEHETHICMLLTGQGLLCTKKIGCFNHLVVTLVGRDSGKKKFILVLEVNCMSNLSPNHHTLQLTTLRTAVSHYKKIYGDFVVILLLWLLYLRDIIACSLMYMQV